MRYTGRRIARIAGFALTLMVSFGCRAGAAADLSVDFSRVVGEIRPLHGGNCGPIQFGELVDVSAYHRELGIPYTRLHDCHWPRPDIVDMHAVFPDPKADPGLAASYDFPRTDDYIQAIVNTGSKIVYRLGESIEHTKKKYYVHPPKDYEKWAGACVGIIRHYNEGWADGFRHDIQYWEIWNEPENRPAMWSGSDEDYLRLYEAASKAIKGRFPKLKVGGPSFGYYGKIEGGRFVPSEFMVKFLEQCRTKSLPLDFFSWHLYSDDPYECVRRARGIREVLDRYGFKATEMHFNEWNYLPNNDWMPMLRQGQGAPRERFYEQIGGSAGAAFSACTLIYLQDSPVTVANYYTADAQGFGLFSTHGSPKTSFHAFKAFRILLDTPLRVEAGGGEVGRLAICAGLNRDKNCAGILIANHRSAREKTGLSLSGIPWTTATSAEFLLVDSKHQLASVRKERLAAGSAKPKLELEAPAVMFIRLRQGE